MKFGRRTGTESEIPTSSMADIAFLLIIFFMLTASFMREKNVSLDLAQSADIDKLKQAHVTVSVDTEGVIRLQGVQLTVEELPSAVEAMTGVVNSSAAAMNRRMGGSLFGCPRMILTPNEA